MYAQADQQARNLTTFLNNKLGEKVYKVLAPTLGLPNARQAQKKHELKKQQNINICQELMIGELP